MKRHAIHFIGSEVIIPPGFGEKTKRKGIDVWGELHASLGRKEKKKEVTICAVHFLGTVGLQ